MKQNHKTNWIRNYPYISESNCYERKRKMKKKKKILIHKFNGCLLLCYFELYGENTGWLIIYSFEISLSHSLSRSSY